MKFNQLVAILMFAFLSNNAVATNSDKVKQTLAKKMSQRTQVNQSQHFDYLPVTKITRTNHRITPIEEQNTASFTFQPENSCSLVESLKVEGSERVKLLISLPKNCLQASVLWTDNEQTRQLYTLDTMSALITEVSNLAPKYNGANDSGIYQLLSFIRAGYFVSDGNSRFSFDNNTQPLRNDLISHLKLLSQSDGWFTDSQYHTNDVLYEWLYIIYNSFMQAELYPELMLMLDTISESKGRNELWLKNVWRVFDVLTRLDEETSKAVEVLVANDDKHFERVLRWGLDRDVITLLDYVPHAPLYWLTNNLLGFESVKLPAIASTKKALSFYPQDSEWFMTLIAGYRFEEKCDDIAAEYCKGSYRENLLNRLYPNSYSFNNNKFVINTGLDYASAQQLYYASQQVKAQYHRVTQNTIPVADDTAEKLTVYVAHSNQHYLNYQNYLFNLPSDNGGIYIEKDATFYTYQRTEKESIYTLEELFRHEYVHYLESRFQIHGFYGEGAFYSSPFEHWEVEGLAEFLSGATAADGIKKRISIMQRLAQNVDTQMTLTEIVNSDSGFAVYPYGAMLHHFMHDKHPEQHTAMFTALKLNNITAYNELLSSWVDNVELGKEFTDYLTESYQEESNWWQPVTLWQPVEKLNINQVADIESSLNKASLFEFSCKKSATENIPRFQCLSTSYTATSALTLSERIDSLLVAISHTDNNGSASYMCYHGALTDAGNAKVSGSVVCEGSLAKTAVMTENMAPIINAEANFLLTDGGTASLDVAIYEPEKQDVTIEWLQISGPDVVFSTPINQKTVEFKAPLVDSDIKLVFKVTVSDGTHTVKGEVEVQLLKLDSHAIYFENEVDDISVNYGELIDLSVVAISLDNKEITYTWQESPLEWDDQYLLSFEASKGASLSFDTNIISLDDFEGFKRRTVRFSVLASDGLSTTQKWIRLYINNSATVNPSNTIITEGDLQDFNAEQNDNVSISFAATSSLGDDLHYLWQQIDVDQGQSYDLQLGELQGESVSIDTRVIPIEAYGENGLVTLLFRAIISDSVNSKEVAVRIYVNKKVVPEATKTTTTITPPAKDKSSGGGSFSLGWFCFLIALGLIRLYIPSKTVNRRLLLS
ncbi:MAG: hypothetical protein ACI9LM_002073 [Alteromonadaceae bacterium]|jgi:hypothetical protein